MSAALQVKSVFYDSTDDQMRPESRWSGLARTLSIWPMPVIVGLLLCLVFSMGSVDYLTGFEVSVMFLYLIPVVVGTWVAGRTMGYLFTLACAGVWLGADCLTRHTYGHWFVPVWNALGLAISFLVVAVLAGSLRELKRGLEQKVARRTEALRIENAQRRQAEEHLRHALDDICQAHADLQRTQFQLIEAAKMESVGRMAAGVAHEVKNPLMDHKTESHDEIQLVEDMKEAFHRASNVINVLLDHARPRPLQRTSEDIHSVIENSLTLLRQQLIKHQVTVRREFDPKRILVVDDERSITRNLKLNLESRGGYEVLGDNSASKAVAAARAFRPDLILLDVMMPGLDGGDLATRLRADPLFRNTPIVFLTALVSNDETHGHELLSGTQTFLAKPVDLDELKKTMEKHLQT